MHIEITGETERLIQATLASGQFASAEEVIAAMAQGWKGMPNGMDIKTIPSMPHRVDLPALLAEQRVKPCENPKSLVTDVWPKDESPDEFLAFLRDMRTGRGNSGCNR